ncbi:mannose-6-phosphate isomerase, type 1 [Porphyromonadaceae bacterium KH3R12]|uniref:type I phosphomannose isomerase catalytic subunit n=1 Tax=Proteiniphilum TaxID=294702 RepID=UPI0008983A59|nr:MULTISPECIES: type I phosphomannose isomerase catalytic subunit [Proteiniphilum]MDY9917242.1 type I phosphomannose isomerase catalytic subunit [Proteiniphilum sp.]SEA05886.1 mannose-6-phosphate isomerase, type 1 [Porphyromonadaceae bacterium KH3R12]
MSNNNNITGNTTIEEGTLYPFKFEPILKPVIWGGSDICRFKNIEPIQEGIGESWEISGVRGNISRISNGYLAGTSLDELLHSRGEELVGKEVYQKFGNTFPLLIKFIDARDDLSIQVHPDDELGKKRHNSFGKTEMWYVVKAAPGAYLYSGFKESITPEEYPETVKNNTFTDKLMKYDVKAGDVFYLPAGRVHAIGTGCFIAEIQQTSDITYRIYDYNRKDAAGNSRELHTELAKDAIDFKVYDSYKTEYEKNINHPVKLVISPYFTTHLLEMDSQMNRDYTALDSFVIYICMAGHCTVKDDKGNSETLRQGESMLIPANTKSVMIIPDEFSKLLETYVG